MRMMRRRNAGVSRANATPPNDGVEQGGPAVTSTIASMSIIAPALAASSAHAAELTFFQLPRSAYPRDVVPAVDGGVWYSGQMRGFLGHFNPKSGANEEIPLGPNAAPHGVIVGPDGAPWLTEGGQNPIAPADPAPRNE